MQAKNSNKPPVAQEALLTDAFPFYQLSDGDDESSLLQVRPGLEAKDALNTASMLACSAVDIMTRLTELGMTTNEVYGIRFLVEASAALIDASLHAVEFGNRQGGAQ